jgi:YHS domain-containing protein
MLKQFVISLVLISFFSLFTLAQEKQGKEKKESNQMENMQMNHNAIKTDNRDLTNQVPGKAWNKVCPVRGGEIDPDVATVEYNGKVYGFCCGGCDSKFKKDPEKYLKNLSKDGKRFIGKK